jgi:hypothetical protein
VTTTDHDQMNVTAIGGAGNPRPGDLTPIEGALA